MLLAYDVAEVRVRGEGRYLVQNRLAHGRLHRITLRVIPEFEVLADFEIRNPLQARGPKSAVGEKE